MAIDRMDRAILRVLEEDGRIGYTALGERVGLSKTPCWKRVQALEKAGVIEGYRATLNPKALGLGLDAFIQVVINPDRHAEFEAVVADHSAIQACYTIAGDGDYLLHVVAEGVEGLDTLLRRDISKLPGVQRSSTTVCLTKIKARSGLAALG